MPELSTPTPPGPDTAGNVRLTVAAQDERSAIQAGEDASTLRTAGQRKINLIWERTHAAIAILVTSVTLSVCAYLVSSLLLSELTSSARIMFAPAALGKRT
jgi:hypothetical protein